MATSTFAQATLGGGCFWCLEAVFQQIQGITAVESGYCGGRTSDPDYESVCGGQTGHAEVVRLEFDTTLISFAEILEIFFTLHDPTTLNRQGNDVGTQYRSVIFYHDNQQQQDALTARQSMQALWDAPIVTEISPLAPYYPAEAYHQNYFNNHTAQGYCRIVVAPKVAKVRQGFAARLRR